MPNKYENQPLHERVIQSAPRSPMSSRGRGLARQHEVERKREAAREKAHEGFLRSKTKTLTKQHFRAARRKGASISWSEARGRAIEQLVRFSGLELA